MSDQVLDGLSVDEKRELLAQLLRQKQSASAQQAVVRSGPAPLSFQQERLWILEQFSPGTSAYNIPLGMRIRGRFDSAAWSRAFRSVIARHETLRSRFVASDDGPRQIAEADSVPLVEEHLERPAREAAWREARKHFEQMAEMPIDLASGPPWRARLIRIADDEVLFAVIVHHIVFDGRSSLVFLNELLAGYRLELRGADSRRTPLALQYSDFARWQRRQLSGETMAALIGYWRETLDGVAQQEMPLDRPRPASGISLSAICQRDVEADALRRIQDFGRRHGTIVYVVLVAAVQAVLARICGQRDVVVGSAVMGRPRTELEGSIGFFANMLALRADVDPNLDFAGLVRQVRDTLKGALAHQDMPFERLVQELDIERVPDRHPLFQVCLNHLQVGAAEVRLPDARVDFLETTRQAAKFDLQVDFRELPSVLRVNVTYNRDLFESETIERLADRVVRLLLAGVEAPETPVRALPLIDAVEHRLLASEWASRRSEAPGRSTLTRRLRHWVESTPEVIAAEDDASRLTYGALGRRSASLARDLVDRGVGGDDRVGVCLGRTPDLVVALVAILRAGATYVPLDPEYPVDRLGAMVTDAAIRCVVADAERSVLVGDLPVPPDRPIDVVSVDAMERPGPDASTAGDPWVEVDPEHVANIIFTSGSTGRPKGVAVTHRSIVRLATADDSILVTPADRFSQMANIGFDASTLEIWGALVHGARLVFVPRDDTLEPARLRARLVDRGITTMLVTSALVRTLIDAEPSMFAGIRQLFFGGEAADPRAIRRIARHPEPPTRLIHAYGPTESTVYATWFAVEDVPEGIQALPIGKPVDGTTAHVVDPWLELAPIGVPGELLLGGEGLARGYVGRPAATAERFVPDPFGDVPGARLYRTGDRARWTSDGVLEFLGRTDDQVKLRGHRVELGEIEHALLDHSGVLEAAVRLLDAPSGAKLVAYWSGDEAVDLDTLIAHLRRRLPAIMIPSAILRLDALPLNANGKVDIGALPEPEEALGVLVAPRTDMERRLATLWGELLDREAISVHDDFFALGGHSLLAVQLAARMRDDLGLDVSVRHVLEAPTVASLAVTIESAGTSKLPAVESIGERED
ncbi:MAG: amino acid adenylation domain-containing protein, partial [Acidobacteriota bacterium]